MTAHGIPPAIMGLRRAVGTAIVLHEVTPHEVGEKMCVVCRLEVRPRTSDEPEGQGGAR